MRLDAQARVHLLDIHRDMGVCAGVACRRLNREERYRAMLLRGDCELAIVQKVDIRAYFTLHQHHL